MSSSLVACCPGLSSTNAHGVSPYIVLANQSVSAAALLRFGFHTYYGAQFYYAIPTGAPLYQSYLDMVYRGATRLSRAR